MAAKLVLLGLVVSHLAVTARAATHVVGSGSGGDVQATGGCEWAISRSGFSYQAWADSINWISDDKLRINYHYLGLNASSRLHRSPGMSRLCNRSN